MNPTFRLFALSTCPHCQSALQFLQANNLPGDVVFADNDPIIDAGVKAKAGESKYPVLLSRLTSEIIVGYKPEDYDRLKNVWDTLIRTGALDMANSGVVTGGETQAPSAEDTSGAK